jgi:hypothetical protein
LGYIAACFVAVAAAILAAGASWGAGRFIKLETRRHYHDVGLPVFAQLGLLLSVLIAFVFSGVWEEYRTAAGAISSEHSALHGAALLAHALPEDKGKPIERAIAVYADTVAHDEWRTMRHRKLSAKARLAFEEIIAQSAHTDSARPDDSNRVRTQILQQVMQAHDQRETRTQQLTQGVPLFIWLTLGVLFVIQAMFLIFAGIEYPMNLIFAAVFSLCTVLVLVSIQLLDFPFEGALALDNKDFTELAVEVNGLASSSVR